ncbi:MAG: S41 family peptidase [Clostridiales Family XIII bacterium]|jgi:carboxyl-terminal processing protease|nr:S41 family peptidase [Clostridiales Family XIII bacterium]
MFVIKKRNLLFLLIVTFFLGTLVSLSVVGAVYMLGGGNALTGAEYVEYAAFKDKYGKLMAFDDYIHKNYYSDIDEGAMRDGVYKGQFASLGDAYTTYYTAEEFKRQNERTQGEFSGIGAYLHWNGDGDLAIERVMEGGSAEKAGLASGDVILLIDGQSYREKALAEAAEQLRGREGTEVALRIRRGGEEFVVKLKRAKVLTPSVDGNVREDGIGYIRLAAFSARTAEDFKAKLAEMEKARVKGLVVDLRDNPGGIVEQGVEVANLLLGAGKVATLRYGDGREQVYESQPGGTGLPYAVLINKNTASTSEILAGAIKDNGGGALVGTATTGKGIVQRLEAFRDGDGARITIAQYFTPDEHPVQGVGISPDFVVEAAADGKSDPQMEKAVELLKKG